MKLRKLARQLAAAAVAGAMALSFCMPALAETWDMSNTEKYPNGEKAWIYVTRPAEDPELNGQSLRIEYYNGNSQIKQIDDAPVLSGHFEGLKLFGANDTTANATLQDAHIEYGSDSNPTLTAGGKVDLTLSGSNTVKYNSNNNNLVAIDIGDYGDYPNRTPGLLTIKGSGSLTATNALSTGVLIDNGKLDVTEGTVDVTAAVNGIYVLGSNTVQVSGGTLCATATSVRSIGINASNFGKVTVSGGKLTASGGGYGIVAAVYGHATVSNGTLCATATDGNGKGIEASNNGKVTVSGGTLCATATGEHGTGIDASSNGQVTVSNGTLCATAAGGNGTGINASNNGKVTVSGGTLTASGGNFGIAAEQLEMSGGTLNASATSSNGAVAITGKSIAVNGGVLNLKKNKAPDGIISQSLEVTNGWLTAKGQPVSANSITVSGGVAEAGALKCSQLDVSGGWVEADTLEPRENGPSSHTVNLSGGNVKLKSVPDSSFTVNFSDRARLTITEPVSANDVGALVEAFKRVQSDLFDTAYLRYKPTDGSTVPDGASMDGSGYVVLRGTQTDPEPNLAANDNDKPLLPGDIAEIGTAPAGDAGGAGGAIAAVALGGAALWGGYEVATRVILHKLLPEGAAIPKTQAQLAVLLWNTAGQPEPVNEPAFADVDAATAKAAQWCIEQGYLSGTFKPDKRVAKYNVIRTWNKAFPKAKDL